MKQSKPAKSISSLLPFLIMGVLILSAMFSAISWPAAQPTPTPGLASTPTGTVPTQTQKPVSHTVCANTENVLIRKGPGKEFETSGGLSTGECVTVMGRSADGGWLYIEGEGNNSGWVFAGQLNVGGNKEQGAAQSVTSAIAVKGMGIVAPTQGKGFESQATPISDNTFAAGNCSELESQIGQRVTCRVEQAYCYYWPDFNGAPTFCDDRPYPSQLFQLVVFGEDWSDLDGECLLVSGTMDNYDGTLQIQAYSRSQVSFCQ